MSFILQGIFFFFFVFSLWHNHFHLLCSFLGFLILLISSQIHSVQSVNLFTVWFQVPTSSLVLSACISGTDLQSTTANVHYWSLLKFYINDFMFSIFIYLVSTSLITFKQYNVITLNINKVTKKIFTYSTWRKYKATRLQIFIQKH